MNKSTAIEIEDAIKDWYNQNAPMGEQLGYPKCCIKEFCDLPPVVLENNKPTDVDRMKFKAACINGVFTGFIPCAYHARMISDGRITLASLIKGRSIFFPPFPNHQL